MRRKTNISGVKLEFMPGTDLKEACMEANAYASENPLQIVWFKFNGCQINASVCDNKTQAISIRAAQDMEADYDRWLYRQMEIMKDNR